MFVHRSNRLAQLVDQLSESLQSKLPGVLDPEIVLIQSAGMERYLSRELSRRNGIVANVRFPFPRAFMREVLDRALGVDERAQAFERENLTWLIFQSLPQHVHEGGSVFEPIRQYLEGDHNHLKRLLLSERLAHFFDQYVTYRPLLVLGWQNGEGTDELQAILWRSLVDRWGDAHFASRCYRFMNETSDEEVRAALPHRLSLLGGPGLPLLFLQMLSRMGQVIPTRLFSFSVCQEYFADGGMTTDFSEPEEMVSPEVKAQQLHPLLISLGKVGADFQQLLELAGDYEEDSSYFFIPESRSLLQGLQKTLLQGRGELGRKEKDAVLVGLGSDDDSLTIDSCHSSLREVETLHDRLLSWFAADPSLRPEDVVVLAPNIEEYSPLVTAVFAARGKSRAPIPFRIADRSEKFTNAATRAFLAALALLRSRFKVSDVLDLLGQEPVRDNYSITQEELSRVTRWVKASGIRWGVDGKHRSEYGLPCSDENTWRFGLRRLLLGTALFDDGEQIFFGNVPFDEISSTELDLLGRFCDYCERLLALRDRLSRAGEAGFLPSEWGDFLQDLAQVTLAESVEGAWNTETVRSTLFEQKEAMASMELDPETAQGRDARLGILGMEHILNAALDERRPSTDFLAGGVTFCSLLPLRTIPFRCVCVLGLNQGKFPRVDPHHELDLMASAPLIGDRSLRADDRYLFLEVLLAAQEKLSLSYVGRSVQDNTHKPPSSVISELMVVIDELVGDEPAGDESSQAKERETGHLKVTQHPLQPYDPAYFDAAEEHLSSWDQCAFVGAKAALARSVAPRPFFNERNASFGVQSPPQGCSLGAEPAELSLDEIISFWKNPSAAFLNVRGVQIKDEVDAFEDREPIVESGLSKFLLGDRLLAQLSQGIEMREDIELARGSLPVGQGGVVALATTVDSALHIFEDWKKCHQSGLVRSIDFSRTLAAEQGSLSEYLGEQPSFREISIVGTLPNCSDTLQVEMTFGRLNVARRLSMWLRHLAFCAEAESDRRSVLIVRGDDKQGARVELLRFEPIAQTVALESLKQFARLAFEGLRVPLRFFPEASAEFFKRISMEKSRVPEGQRVSDAYRCARKLVLPDGKFSSPDASVVELYRFKDPLGQRDDGGNSTLTDEDLAELPFARLASFVFYPLLQASKGNGT